MRKLKAKSHSESDTCAPHQSAWLTPLLCCTPWLLWADWTWKNYANEADLQLNPKMLQLFHYSLFPPSSCVTNWKTGKWLERCHPFCQLCPVAFVSQQSCDGPSCAEIRATAGKVFFLNQLILSWDPQIHFHIISFCFRLLFSALKSNSLLKSKCACWHWWCIDRGLYFCCFYKDQAWVCLSQMRCCADVCVSDLPLYISTAFLLCRFDVCVVVFGRTGCVWLWLTLPSCLCYASALLPPPYRIV